MSFQDDAARVPGSAARPNSGGSEHQERVIPPAPDHHRPTRTAALWVAVAVGLVVLVVLIAFFVQNQDMITVRFFGLEGTLALGTTLFIAAVGGGVLVALAGGARILQLRLSDHRRKKAVGGSGGGY
ncbi:LapA family protein [Arthrobacter sp. 31Y]|uniref:LapA family protein n=1 Tax=Arthrobacter sp. 31Y TaxID=1115632 RepID=UPI000466912A|nr:LapA family protein [Arthrobacter sp. 31Y]